MFGVRVGQNVEIVNSDTTAHNVHALPNANQEFNFSQQIQNQKDSRFFTAPEVMVRFKCDMHNWMSAFAGVLEHPYFAVTEPGGRFELKQLPPGTYTIEAWHEKLGTQTQRVTLAEKGSADVSFTFKARRTRSPLARSTHRQGSGDFMRTTAAMTIGARARATDFVALAKPRLNLLVVASTVAGYAMAHGDTTNLAALGWTIVGTALVAGGASAINQVIERDADSLMRRTRLRPLPDGRLGPVEALAFAAILSVLGLLVLAGGVNVLSAVVALATLVSYAAIYTPLKRRTSFATVIGAIPGALPPVIGWAAAEGTLSQGAWVLFGDPLPLAIAALPRHRLDVPRGLCPRRLPDAAGDRARRPQHRAPGRGLRRRAAAGGTRADAGRDVGHCLLRRRPASSPCSSSVSRSVSR